MELKACVYDNVPTSEPIQVVHAEPVDEGNTTTTLTPLNNGTTTSTNDPLGSPERTEQSSNLNTNIDDDEEKNNDRIIAAGIGSGVIGFFIAGPIGAMALGFAGAYAAEKKKHGDVIGDTARAVGDVTLNVKSKATEINQQHHVIDKSKAVAEDVWNKAKQADQEHKILDKTKDLLIYSWMVTVNFVKEHNLIERGMNGIGKGICWVLEKIATTTGNKDSEENTGVNSSNKKDNI